MLKLKQLKNGVFEMKFRTRFVCVNIEENTVWIFQSDNLNKEICFIDERVIRWEIYFSKKESFTKLIF